jgi:hypothetical protein
MDGRSSAILLLSAALILHLVEEVRTGFRQKLPVGEMPLPVFAGLNMVIYAFCFATLALSLRGRPWAVPLAWISAGSMVLNGLGHLGMMVSRKRYFPGGLTASLLLLTSGYLIVQLRC